MKKDEKELAREQRRRLKEERLRKKERKLRKKAKLEKECLTEKMNCFEHDNDHWRTAPLWTAGPFCFCMNANNNTYSCVRTINVTHNFLYCEFTTGLVTYYNLRIGEYVGQSLLRSAIPSSRTRGSRCTTRARHEFQLMVDRLKLMVTVSRSPKYRQITYNQSCKHN